MALKLRVRTQFPAVVIAADPIIITKNGVTYTFSFDADAFSSQLLINADNITTGSQTGTGAMVRAVGPSLTGPVTITSPSVSSLAVGLNGATNPAFLVDDSVALQAAGIKVVANAAGGGAGIIAISSATDEALALNAKGAGGILIGNVSSGPITLTRATTLSQAMNYGGVTLSNSVTGTGSMVLSTGATLVTPALGTPSALVGTNITGTAAGLTAGNVTTNANLTGPVTSVGNATTIGANQVSRANLAQGVARSIVGVTGNATANVADIQAAANGFLVCNSAGNALVFASIAGDATNAGSTLTVTKTNGVAFTAGATAAAGQLPGEPSTGSASAGNVGEYIENVTGGAFVTLSTGVAANAGQITLTAGDWDVDGTIYFTSATTTSITQTVADLSTTTGTFDVTFGRWNAHTMTAFVPGAITGVTETVAPYRFSVSGSTTVFLVARANFTVAGLTAGGIIRARRVR